MSSLLVFPGQGAQQPGMLQRLAQSPQARACLQEASDVLGQDVLTLDSPQALASTRAVQLCLLIAGVAAARTLLQPDTRVNYVAGLSIGAYPAAVVAGALQFADALRLVSLRGELMQQAYPQGYGMTALIGLELAAVEGLLAQVH
ncbi:acyltransferase domain-containing protein, partial [Pseudomonas protegens]